MEMIQIRTRVKKTQNKKFQKIARQKAQVEPFETEEEALEFVTNLSMDYTKWQENLMEDMSVKEISDKAVKYRQTKAG